MLRLRPLQTSLMSESLTFLQMSTSIILMTLVESLPALSACYLISGNSMSAKSINFWHF
jgi:hypothetical protein